MNEEEINERVRFKLNDMWNAIDQAVKRNTVLAYELTLNGDIRGGQKAQHYREAFEQFKSIFDKEISMALPYDNLAELTKKGRRDVAVDSIMRLMRPEDRIKINSVVSVIEKALDLG